MPHVNVVTRKGIAHVTLDRPKVNALDRPLMRTLRFEVDKAADDPAVLGVLLCGRGRAFSAGLDLRRLLELDEPGLLQFMAELDLLITTLLRFPKPMAVAIEGHAIAGGLVIAAAADYMVLAPGEYRVGLSELAVGVPFPRPAIEAVRLAFPPRALRRLVYTADLLPPTVAYELGVGDHLSDAPEEAALSWLGKVTDRRRPARTFAWAKRQLREESWTRIQAAGAKERQAVVAALMSDPVREALRGSLRR